MPLDPVLKELLVCPQCRGALEEHDGGLLCSRDGLLFPIRDGLPVMLLDEATKISATTQDASNDAAPDSFDSANSSQLSQGAE